MNDLDLEQTHILLNEIIEYELAGVVRYTLLVDGSWTSRIPIVEFSKAQAAGLWYCSASR